MMPGSSADALVGTLPPDASTLVATAFSVGMISSDSFGKTQDDKVRQLVGHVGKWLQQGPAVVGLNEIAPIISVKLVEKLNMQSEVGVAIHESNTVLWRISINLCLPCLVPQRPASCRMCFLCACCGHSQCAQLAHIKHIFLYSNSIHKIHCGSGVRVSPPPSASRFGFRSSLAPDGAAHLDARSHC